MRWDRGESASGYWDGGVQAASGELLRSGVHGAGHVAPNRVQKRVPRSAPCLLVAAVLGVIATVFFYDPAAHAPVTIVILLIDVAVLGYIVKETLAPIPGTPYN
jgi:hypothetical protein